MPKMAASILVADYGSSDSENDEETSIGDTEPEGKCADTSAGVNLLATAEDKSDSDTDSDAGRGASRTTASSSKGKTSGGSVDTEGAPEKLPLPSALGVAGGLATLVSEAGVPSSIFANPFAEAEKRRLSILEQHVKLTSARRKEAALGGAKQICWKFRAGRCRFGHKCRFAHDSDVPSALARSAGEESPSGAAATTDKGGRPGGAWSGEAAREEGEEEEEEEGGSLARRKRRPGLSQTLIPSKKVMTNFARQRTQANPWSQHR